MVIFSVFKEIYKYVGGKRLFKITGIGGSAYTAKESMPFGIDANPIAGMTAIYANSTNVSERVVIGYINRFQQALEGEVRIYAVSAEKDQPSAYIWCHTNDVLDLNGNQYSSVRFEPLNTRLQTMVNNINAENVKIQAAIVALGGTYARADITLNINTAQSPDVRLK